MTDDQQDINSEDVEQQEVSNKAKKSNIKTFIYLIIALVISCIIIVYTTDSHPCSLTEKASSFVAQSVLQSLQSGAAIYVAQEKITPDVFSDFTISKGEISRPATITLENVDCTVEGLKTKEMKLSFEPRNEATYYLNGTDITASFSFKSEEPDLDKIFIDEFFLFKVLTLTVIIFIILCFNNTGIILKIMFRGDLLIILFLISLILLVFLAVATPKFKPAIYLYPTKPTNINVTIDKNIDLTLDIPKYQPDKGWNVLAYPDGKIVDLQPEYTNCNKLDTKRFGMEYAKEACNKNNYPYLYWEGITKNKPLPKQINGWLVKTANIKTFLTSKLDYVGFNKAEKDEFIRYWSHKVAESKQDTAFISFMQTEAVNNDNSLTITPTPDSINRFYIVVDLNVKNHKNPAPQILTSFKRTGFTVVDWGGCVIDHDHK